MNKKLHFIFLTILSLISIEGRLVQKNKTKSAEIVQTENPNPAIRLTRNIEVDYLRGFSKEDAVQSDEFIQSYNRRARHFFKSKSKPNRTSVPKLTRKVRNSNENLDNSTKIESPVKIKTILVKKPIPKFSDIDYEDDFQTKMSSAQSILGDSGDHEDEDFNLDDYDFDVNHDEFTSGRKHLEPRLNKNISDIEATLIPDIIISQIANPSDRRATKKERSAEQYSKKLSEKTKEDYYYDEVRSTKPTHKENKIQDAENEYSDENDDSKENNHKTHYIRSVRSWDVNAYLKSINDKTSKFITKFLSVLPMFPEVPRGRYLDKNNYPIDI